MVITSKCWKLYTHTINQSRKYSSLGPRIRIEQARSTDIKMKKVFCGQVLSIELKLQLMRCYVLAVLNYGMEEWKMKRADIRKSQRLSYGCINDY